MIAALHAAMHPLIRRSALTVFACCVSAQTSLAAQHATAQTALPQYTGKLTSEQTRTKGTAHKVVRSGGVAHLTYEVKDGTLFVGMKRPMGEGWKQAFVVKSDQTGPDGARVIEFERPDHGSKMGKLNQRALGPHPLLRVLGGYTDMMGWGELAVSDDKVRFTNRGASPLRLGFSTSLNTWDETFEGSRVK